jgi:hypothetical protein
MRCWWHFQKGDRGVSRHIKKKTRSGLWIFITIIHSIPFASTFL